METVVQKTQIIRTKPSLIGIFASPHKQFEKMKVVSPILMPLLIISLLSMACTFLIATNSSDNTALQAVAKALNTSTDQVRIVTGVIASLSSLATLIFNFVITSIFIKIFLAFTHKNLDFKTVFSMNVHIGIVALSFTVLNLVINLALHNTEFISYTSLILLSSKGTILYPILKTLDIASLWTILLTAIGLYDLAKMSKKQAGTFALIVLLFNFAMNYFTNL